MAGSDIDLGTLSAQVALDMSGLQKGIQQAKQLLVGLGTTLQGVSALKVAQGVTGQIGSIGAEARRATMDVQALAKAVSQVKTAPNTSVGRALQGGSGLTAYQREFEANRAQSMMKSGRWSAWAVSEWKSRYEAQQKAFSERGGNAAQELTLGASSAGQSTNEKSMLRLTDQLRQNKIAWGDYYAAIERLGQREKQRLTQMQAQSARIAAAMMPGGASDKGDDAAERRDAEISLAQKRYVERMSGILSLQAKSGLGAGSPEIASLNEKAESERQGAVAKAQEGYALSVANARAALDRFTASLEKSLSRYRAATGTRGLGAAENSSDVASQNAVLAKIARSLPSRMSDVQAQKAAGLIQETYGASVNASSVRQAGVAQSEQLAALRTQFQNLEGAYKRGDTGLRQYLVDLEALSAQIKAMPSGTAQTGLQLDVSRQIQGGQRQMDRTPIWAREWGSSLASLLTHSWDSGYGYARGQVGRERRGAWSELGRSGGESLMGLGTGGIRQLAERGLTLVFSELSGLFRKRSPSTGIVSAVGGEASRGAIQKLPSDIAKVRPEIQSAMSLLTHGLSGVVVQAEALMSLSGAQGKRRQRSSLLGGILGGIAGAFTGNWFGGAQIGSALGGMFAEGGQMNLRKWNMVGEKGPELVGPGGFVVPLSGVSGRSAVVPDSPFFSGDGMAGSAAFHKGDSHFHGDIHVHVANPNANPKDVAWAIRRELSTATAGS